MLLGYNTAGWAYHDPLDAVRILGGIGFTSVALSVDRSLLPEFSDVADDRVRQLAEVLDETQMRCSIDATRPYVLDSQGKQEPSLLALSPAQRQTRIDHLVRAISIADMLSAECVSFCVGDLPEGCPEEEGLERLAASLQPVVEFAQQAQVTLAIEPRRGMFVSSATHVERLSKWMDDEPWCVALNVPSMMRQAEVPISSYLERWGSRLAQVRVADIKPGDPQLREIGEGDIDFAAIVGVLKQIDFHGEVVVDLCRFSDEAPAVAQRAFAVLGPLIADN